jgi:hypothetical protein
LLWVPLARETPQSTEKALGRPEAPGAKKEIVMPTNNKKAKKERPKKLAVNRSAKATEAGMVAQGKLIGKQAPSSTIWQSNAAVKQTGQDAIDACAQLGTDITDVSQLEVQLEAARSKKATDAVIAGSKLDLFFTTGEDVAVTPKDLQDLGLSHLTGHVYTLTNPVSVTAAADPDTHDVSAHVKRAAGMKRCSVEISGDPTFATGVKVFPGDGARQTMGPFAPGTYYVRACHIRASERSGYTDTVTVVVK